MLLNYINIGIMLIPSVKSFKETHVPEEEVPMDSNMMVSAIQHVEFQDCSTDDHFVTLFSQEIEEVEGIRDETNNISYLGQDEHLDFEDRHYQDIDMSSPTPAASVSLKDDLDDPFYGIMVPSPPLAFEFSAVTRPVRSPKDSIKLLSPPEKRQRISFGSAFFSCGSSQDTGLPVREDTIGHTNTELFDQIVTQDTEEISAQDAVVEPEVANISAVVHTAVSCQVDVLDSGRYRSLKGPNSKVVVLTSDGPTGNFVQLTKEMLRNARVISQADRKFIIARIRGSIVCLDQHAADERVQLESLEKAVYGKAGFDMEVLVPPERVSMSSYELNLLQLYSPSIAKYGFNFSSVDGNDVDGSSSCTLLLHSAPRIMGVILTGEDMKSLIYQMKDSDPSAVGLGVKPSVFQYILSSKACRSAVMFGDYLDNTVCETLLRDLATCDLPFQCAHGRPSSVVLAMDLREILAHSYRSRAARKTRFSPCDKLKLARLSAYLSSSEIN